MITYTITLELDLILDQTAPRVLLIFDLLGKLQYLSSIVSLIVICHMVWIQIRADSVSPDLGPNCWQMLSAADKICC